MAESPFLIPIMGGGGKAAPSWDQNVQSMAVTATDDTATIKWADPASADWAGSTLIRKQGSAPTSPTDGVQVVDSVMRNQYGTTGYADAGLIDGATYHYLVVPRNAAKAQTFNEANRRSVTIAFVYPSALTSFSVTAGDERATIAFTLPGNATGVRIVYKTGGYPTSISDGTVIASATSGQAVTGLTNAAQYFFRAYPYNAYGRYNTTTSGNQATATPTEVVPSPVTGFSAAVSDSQVTLTFTKPGDATGVRIVHKAGSYPTGIDDGTVIAAAVTGQAVTGLANGIARYFRAFPYNAAGRYNTTTTGQQITASPTEIIPSPVTGFTLTAGNGQITVAFTKPGDATGVRLVYKTGSYPTGIDDGTVISSATTGQVITGLTNNVAWYVRAFPYNSYGRYNTTTTGQQATATPKTYDTALANNSWADIAAASAEGLASTLWKIGDTKTETINGATQTFEIIGFDHDNLNAADARYNDTAYNGNKKKAGVTFCMRDLLSSTAWAMHSTASNVGGWNNSAMRTTRMATIKGYMPSALQNVLRTVSKLTSAGNKSSSITTSADQLFLLSSIEVSGSAMDAIAGEGTRYAYFQAGNSNVKNRNGSAYAWWVRSPFSDNASWYLLVTASGLCGDVDGADSPNGVAVAFCL